MGIRAASNGAKGRYRFRAQATGSSLVDGRRFLTRHGLRVEKTRTLPAEVVGDGIVGFSMPRTGAAAESQREGETTGAEAARTSKLKAAPRRDPLDGRRGASRPSADRPPFFVWLFG